MKIHPSSVWNDSAGKEYYRIFSHAFIHADMWHLLFNMFSFYSFAFVLENYLGSTLFFYSLLWINPSKCLHICILKNKTNPVYRSLGRQVGIRVIFSYILFQPMSGIKDYVYSIPIPAFVLDFYTCILLLFLRKPITIISTTKHILRCSCWHGNYGCFCS